MLALAFRCCHKIYTSSIHLRVQYTRPRQPLGRYVIQRSERLTTRHKHASPWTKATRMACSSTIRHVARNEAGPALDARLATHRVHVHLHYCKSFHAAHHLCPSRDIKTKIKKVALNMSDIEIKVEEATNNEPWGPHGTAMAGMHACDSSSSTTSLPPGLRHCQGLLQLGAVSADHGCHRATLAVIRGGLAPCVQVTAVARLPAQARTHGAPRFC